MSESKRREPTKDGSEGWLVQLFVGSLFVLCLIAFLVLSPSREEPATGNLSGSQATQTEPPIPTQLAGIMQTGPTETARPASSPTTAPAATPQPTAKPTIQPEPTAIPTVAPTVTASPLEAKVNAQATEIAQMKAEKDCPANVNDIPSTGLDCATKKNIVESLVAYYGMVERVCVIDRTTSNEQAIALLSQRTNLEWAKAIVNYGRHPNFTHMYCVRHTIHSIDSVSSPPTGSAPGSPAHSMVGVETTEMLTPVRPTYSYDMVSGKESSQMKPPRGERLRTLLYLSDGIWKVYGSSTIENRR